MSSSSGSSSGSQSANRLLELELIGSDLGTNGGHTHNKWRSIAEGGGKLFCAPYYEDYLLVIDPSDDTTSNGGTVAGASTRKYVDTVNASDGFIYANPAGNTSYLQINPSPTGSDPHISALNDPSAAEDSYLGFNVEHLRGGAETGGNIYASVYSRGATITNGQVSTPYVVKFDISESTSSNYGRTLLDITFPTDSSGDRTGGIYDDRPNWVTEIDDLSTATENSRWVYDSYYGSTKASNGKIYLTPYGADKIVIIDPTDDSVTVGSDLITGNEPYYTGALSDPIIDNHAYWNKYSGGTFVPANGCIYCFPRHGNAILKIDTSDDSATEIQLPSALRIAETTHTFDPTDPVTTYKNKSFSSVLGPDGTVYSVPYEIPYIFWIDPATDQIGYKEISSELAGSGSKTNTATDSWYSYGVTVGDYIYMAPQKANYVIKIGFPSSSSGSAKSYSSVSESQAQP